MAVYSAEEANKACKEGVFWRYQQLFCEPYTSEIRPTQCFKCWKWGHTQKYCRSKPACGNCGTTPHLQANEECERAPRCAVCGGKHLARARECPVGQQAWQRAKSVYESRPRAYEPLAQTPIFNLPPTATPIPATQTPGPPPASVYEFEGTEGLRRKRPCRGRPTDLSKAGVAPGQTALSFSQPSQPSNQAASQPASLLANASQAASLCEGPLTHEQFTQQASSSSVW